MRGCAFMEYEIVFKKTDKGGVLDIITDDGIRAGYLSYSIVDSSTIDLEHTKVFPEFEGNGLGRRLVTAAMEYAERNGLETIASCSYAKHVLDEKKGIDTPIICKRLN